MDGASPLFAANVADPNGKSATVVLSALKKPPKAETDLTGNHAAPGNGPPCCQQSRSRPSASLGRSLNRFEQLLYFYSVIEIGVKLLVLGQAIQKVSQGRDERVLIADDMSRRPEMAGIRMSRASDEDIMAALHFCRIVPVEDFQPVQIFEVETNRAFRTMELEIVSVPAADGKPGSLKGTDASIRKSSQRENCVIHLAIRHERLN
jgi:hypothetical protein